MVVHRGVHGCASYPVYLDVGGKSAIVYPCLSVFIHIAFVGIYPSTCLFLGGKSGALARDSKLATEQFMDSYPPDINRIRICCSGKTGYTYHLMVSLVCRSELWRC